MTLEDAIVAICPDGCGGCACHVAAPCSHCVDHVIEGPVNVELTWPTDVKWPNGAPQIMQPNGVKVDFDIAVLNPDVEWHGLSQQLGMDHKCECGSEKTGLGGHSLWCPKFD